MVRVASLLAVMCAFGAAPALAQTASQPGSPWSPGFEPGQLGVDVWSTVNPRAPTSTITPIQSTAIPGTPAETSFVPRYATGVPGPGDITVYPSLTTAAFFDDNVFATTTNRLSDWVAVVRPELAWRSNNWSNAQWAGAAFVEQRWYSRFHSEDQLNAGAVTGGSVQPDANTQLVGRLQYLHAHEERGASSIAGLPTALSAPIRYDQVEGAGAINKRFDRVWTSLGAAGVAVRYQDATDVTGATIPQAYRSGLIARVPARLGYVVAPLTSVFVEVSGNRRDFQVNDFDSRGYRVVSGVLFEPGPGARVRGEAFGGYMNQVYNGATFQTVSTWTYGAALAFLIAPNVTAVFEGRRDAKEASLSGGVCADPTMLGAGCTGPDGVSVIETVGAGRVDVRVAPNVVVGGGASFLTNQFLGTIANGRVDRAWSPLFSVKYFPNPHVILGFDYRYLNFDSTGGPVGAMASPYAKNVYLFSANWRL